MHAAQFILQDGEQRYFAFTCFSFWVAEDGLIAFVVDSMANVNNMMLKIYILVNIEREGFTATQAGIEHDVDGGAETVVALVN